jgi:hypothetical protein
MHQVTDWDISAEQIADAVWLYIHGFVDNSQNVISSSASPDQLASAKSIPESLNDVRQDKDLNLEQRLPSIAKETIKTSQQREVFPRTQHSRRGQGGNADQVSSPAAPALEHKLALAQALRPLKRLVPSQWRKTVDIQATVKHIANIIRVTGADDQWEIISQPATERWLDLILVVDGWSSMMIWSRTIDEFHRLLEQQGVFRNIQLWSIRTTFKPINHVGVCELTIHQGWGYKARHNPPRSEKELIDPTSRRIILVLTDCVSPAWYSGDIAKWLHLWGAQNPVALVNLLPQPFWSRTALGHLDFAWLRSPYFAAPNRHYHSKPASQLSTIDMEGRSLGESIRVPILALDPLMISAWTAAVTNSSKWMGGYVIPTVPVFSDAEDWKAFLADRENQAPEQLVKTFQATASPQAQKLAGYLSVMPLTIPVMRLVQHVMLPNSRREHLAEIFLSGLVQRPLLNEILDVSPDHLLYNFVPGTRPYLRSTILQNQEDSLYTKIRIGGFIDQYSGQAVDFTAVVKDLNSLDHTIVDPNDSPFAILVTPTDDANPASPPYESLNIRWPRLWTSMRPIDSTDITGWLNLVGLKFNPFGPEQAELDSQLSDYYVEPNTFHRLRRQEPSLIIGADGSGKTACALLLAHECVTPKHNPPSQIFPIYCNFSRNRLINYSKGMLCSGLADAVGEVVVLFYAENQELFLRLDGNRKKAVATCMLHYAHSFENILEKLKFAGLADNEIARHFIRELEINVPKTMPNFSEQEWLVLIRNVRPINFTCIYLIVDIDLTDDQLIDKNSIEYVQNFIAFLNPLADQTIYVKLFIATTVAERLSLSSSTKIFLEWQDEALLKLLSARIDAASGEKKDFRTLFDLSSRVLNPALSLVKAAQGSPRLLIQLGNLLLKHHSTTKAETPELSYDELEIVLATVLPRPKLPLYSNKLFVNRETEIAIIRHKVKAILDGNLLEKRTVIFTGEHGIGKSWLLHYLQEQVRSPAVAAHYFNLESYFSQSEFATSVQQLCTDIWQALFNSNMPAPTSLEHATHLLITEIKRQLLHQVLVLLIDTVYEAPSTFLALFEAHLLQIFAINPKILIVLAGRGREYVFRSPELRLRADFITLPPFSQSVTLAQLHCQLPSMVENSAKIHAITQGNPKANWLLGTNDYSSLGLSLIIDEMLAPIQLSDKSLIRSYLEALAVPRRFDYSHVPHLLSAYYADDKYERLARREVRNIFDKLLDPGLIYWNTNQLAYTIHDPTRYLLLQYLKGTQVERWRRLQLACMELYQTWVSGRPRNWEQWQSELEYHTHELSERKLL